MMRLATEAAGRSGVVARLAGLLLAAGVVGCDGTKPPTPAARPFEGIKLVVAVVGDPALLGSVATQRGEWRAQTGADLVLRDGPVDPKALKGVDVVVFPGDRMGDLVDAGALAVLPDSAVLPAEPSAEGDGEPVPDALAYKDIAPAFRDQVAKYGPDRMGLPIGGSALVVAYRRSAFDDPATREAARAAGLTLEPPKTWDQFDALARFFHGRDWDGDGRPGAGVAQAWGPDAEGVGDSIFLARSAGLALHRDQYSFLLDSETTGPRVASPPFVEALKALVALKDSGPPGAEKFDAAAARQAFRSGQAALLIDRAERAATWSVEGTAVGVAPLPGSKRVYDPSRNAWEDAPTPNRPSYLPSGGGWLVGVAASSPNRAAAEGLVKYLAGPDSTNRLRAERGFPMLAVRTTQLAQGLTNPRSAPGVEPRPWADAVGRTLGAEKVAPGLRIPGASDYLADLAKARVAAVDGEPPEAALAGLAKAWGERTKALGLDRQTWHHRRSLNGPTTAAKPPGR